MAHDVESFDHQVALRRLGALHISPAVSQSPESAVRHILAVQAQDFPSAVWAVGLRASGSTAGDVLAALERGSLVRSWPMRGTLHIVPAEDLSWMLDVTRDRMMRATQTRRAQLGITDAEISTARRAAERVLSGGTHLTRHELTAVFDAAGLAIAGQRAYHLIVHLAFEKVLVFGPPRGDRHTFALFDEWITAPRLLERDEALAEFARRYFLGHGPATDRDLARWASLTLADARSGIHLAGEALDRVTIGNTDYLLAPDTHRAATGVHVLPAFDELLIGYADRSAVISAADEEFVVPSGNGVYRPVIVRDGRVVGTWRSRRVGDDVSLEPSLFPSRANDDLAQFEEAAAGYLAFLGNTLIARS